MLCDSGDSRVLRFRVSKIRERFVHGIFVSFLGEERTKQKVQLATKIEMWKAGKFGGRGRSS